MPAENEALVRRNAEAVYRRKSPRSLLRQARRTRGAVEALNQELAWYHGENSDVFVLRSPPSNDLVQLRYKALLAAVGREGLVEAADFAGSLVRMNHAFARSLVVLPLGDVPDTAGLPFVPRFDSPVEALREVAKAGPGALVVGAALDALLVAFGWCGHAGSSDLRLT